MALGALVQACVVGAIGGAIGCATGCASATPARRADSGWSDGTAPSASAAPQARRQERWDIAGQLRFLRPATQRAKSEHLGGDLEGEVLAAVSVPYPHRAPTTPDPPGTTLVERLFAVGSSAPVMYLVMVKQQAGFDSTGDDWEYVVVAADGRVEDRGRLPLCIRCHAEAPQGHLFGGRR